MRQDIFRPISATILLVLVFLQPAAAQDVSAKEAWSSFRDAAQENGIVIQSQGTTDYGTSIVVQNVRVFHEDEPNDLVISMPELRVEPRGAAIALIPSPQFTADLRYGRGYERELTFSHNGEVVVDESDDRIAVDFLFGQLGIVLTEATRRGVPLDEALDLSFDTLAGRFLAEREGTLEFALSADTTRYDLRFVAPSSGTPMNQTSQVEISGLQLEVSGTELDMLSDEDGMLPLAFDAGFSAHLLMSTQSSFGNSQQVLDGAPVTINSAAGASEFAIDIADGTFSAHSFGRDAQISGGMGPFQGNVELEELGLSVSFPLVVTPDDQTLHYRMNLDNLTVSPELLQMVGAQDFAGESVSLGFEVSTLARMIEEIGPDFGEGDTPPFEVTSVSLDRLLTRVGDTELTGAGAFAFLGGIMASIEAERPNGTGDFTFDLVGGDQMLTRLSAMGLIPEDQQFIVRMMMNGLGRPIAEDHLRSEVAIRPGGVITVNGAPLPF